MTALHAAAASGSAAAARALLTGPHPPAVNAVDPEGNTSLHLAVKGGHLEVAALLMEHKALATLRGPHWSAGSHDYVSAVELAALLQNWEMVKLIVARKPRLINNVLAKNESLLSRAWRSPSGRAHVPWLLQHGASCPRLLTSLVEAGNMDALRELLDMGADPNSPALLRECAKRGKLSMLTELLDRGADPNVEGLLVAVAQQRDWATLIMLLDRGASADWPQLTALVASRGEMGPLRMLLDRGADPSTPMLLAAAARHHGTAMLELLLARGASPDCPQLLVALAEQCRWPTLMDLLDRGASPNHPELLVAVAKRGHMKLLYDLIGRGADPTTSPQLLVTLAEQGETGAVRDLLDRGASPDNPALLLAVAEHANFALLDVLVERGASPASPALLTCVAEQGNAEALLRLLHRGAPLDAPGMLTALAATGQLGMLQRLVELGADLGGAPGLPEAAVSGGHVQVLDFLLGQGFVAQAVDWGCLLRPEPPGGPPPPDQHARYGRGPDLSYPTKAVLAVLRKMEACSNDAPSSSSGPSSLVAQRAEAQHRLRRLARRLQQARLAVLQTVPRRPALAGPWQRAFLFLQWVVPGMLRRGYWGAFGRPVPAQLDLTGGGQEQEADARKMACFWWRSPLWAAICSLDAPATALLLRHLDLQPEPQPGRCGIRFIDDAIQQGLPARPWDCPFYQLVARHQAGWECDPAGWAAAELAAAGVAEALLQAGVRPMDQASLLALTSLALRAPERRSTRERVLQSFGDSALLNVLQCPAWSPATHLQHPPRFRAAARTALLALTQRGVSAPRRPGPGSPGPRPQLCLPYEVAELVLRHMAASLLPWLDPAPGWLAGEEARGREDAAWLRRVKVVLGREAAGATGWGDHASDEYLLEHL